jgi:hypothetical protein
MAVPATELAQQPDPLDPAEALLATVGLTTVLLGEMPLVGVMLQRRALAIPARIKKLAKDMVADELPKKLTMPRHIGYDKFLKLLSGPLPEQLIENITLKFPANVHDQAVQFVALVSRIHDQLAKSFPTQDYQTALGPVKIEPTSDRTWKFYSAYWTAADPLVAFQLMQQGALLPSQVGSIQGYYPTVYENMKSAVFDSLVAEKGGADMLQISPRLDRSVTTFLGNKMVPFGSNKHLVTPDMVNPPQPVTQSSPSSGLVSPAQKAAGP